MASSIVRLLLPWSERHTNCPGTAGTQVYKHVRYKVHSDMTQFIVRLVYSPVYGFLHVTSAL